MRILEKLKAATREVHERIEEQNLARHIVNHNIDLATYKILLLQNYLAYRATEREIKKQLPQYSGNKHLQIFEDLTALLASKDIPSDIALFECHSKAQALGAAYVVEGSALGGMVIAKNLKKCPALSGLPKQQFFSGDKDNLNDWKNFKEMMANSSLSPKEEQEVIDKAIETFLFFEDVFKLEFA